MRYIPNLARCLSHFLPCAMLATAITLAGCAANVPPTTEGEHFARLTVVQQQAARCTDSQGSWYAGLMACACPAETLFHPSDGCIAAPPLEHVSSDGAQHRLPLRLGTLALYLDTRQPSGAHMRRSQRLNTVDSASLVMDRLTLPTQIGTHALTHALAEDIDAAYAVWVLGTFSTVGPHCSPWHPNPGRLTPVKKACGPALKKRGLRHFAALCDTAASMQRELRKRGTPSIKRVSPWDKIAWQSMPEPQLARLVAQWRSCVTQAHYVIHLQDDGALQRHIRVQFGDEQLVLFLDATGAVTAGATATATGTDEGSQPSTQPAYFDASWQEVLPS